MVQVFYFFSIMVKLPLLVDLPVIILIPCDFNTDINLFISLVNQDEFFGNPLLPKSYDMNNKSLYNSLAVPCQLFLLFINLIIHCATMLFSIASLF